MRSTISKSGFLVACSLLATTILWVVAHRAHFFTVQLWPWRGPAQIVMLWSATLASLAILAVVRAHALEFLFNGMDQAVILHRKLGLAALVLMAVHGLLLGVDAAWHGLPIANVFVPFWSGDERWIDIIAFYLLLGLGVLAYNKRMRYEPWLRFHRFIGLLFLVGTLHAAMEPGTIHDYEPLRTWIVILLLVGTSAWAYRIYFFQRFGPRYRYRVVSARNSNPRTIDLVMEPVEKRMMYIPGNFVFISIPGFQGKEGESHPFSISSCPTERNLRLSISQLGDFTRQLSTLDPGTSASPAAEPMEVDVYGPFGNFTLHRFAPYRRMVWIGAGIGITPFLSMLRFESSNKDFRRIWLYYVARNPDDAAYDAEIRDNLERADSYVDYTLWISSESGRITAKAIMESIELDDYAVMLCGTKAFVADMEKQFAARGMPAERIISEELQFR